MHWLADYQQILLDTLNGSRTGFRSGRPAASRLRRLTRPVLINHATSIQGLPVEAIFAGELATREQLSNRERMDDLHFLFDVPRNGGSRSYARCSFLKRRS